MKPDKGNITMNIIFGAFLLVSMVRTGITIYDWQKRRNNNKQCGCGN
ncbi:hypothetical protein [Aquimarina pacifica]|nr:hypothetical protein [Aquimarina pacifica]